jgi:hypothetical protein
MATVRANGAMEEHGFYWKVAMGNVLNQHMRDSKKLKGKKRTRRGKRDVPDRALRCGGSTGRAQGTALLGKDGLSAPSTRHIDRGLKLESRK